MSENAVPTPADVAAVVSPEPVEPDPAVEVVEAVESEPNGDDGRLPDDHPLVKTLAAQKEKIAALQEKARRLDEIEESNKSEAEKASERLAAAEAEAAEAKAKNLRLGVALEHNLSTDDIALLEGITDEGIMRALAARLAPTPGVRVPAPNPGQGSSPSAGAPAGQISRDELAGMSPEKINKALADGRLDGLLGR